MRCCSLSFAAQMRCVANEDDFIIFVVVRWGGFQPFSFWLSNSYFEGASIWSGGSL
jgi:hypothetical protein